MSLPDLEGEPRNRDRPLQPIPSFYDDLDATLAEAWRHLARGVKDRRSPFHTPAIATVSPDGLPQVRTVVLRAVDVASRRVRFHTDCRSNKFRALSAQPAIALLGYDVGAKIQLRVSGHAILHRGNDVAQAAWAASQARSRVCYTQAIAPGVPMSTGAVADQPVAEGFENFTAVDVMVDEIDWLYLAHAGHRRARFTWPDGQAQANWIAP